MAQRKFKSKIDLWIRWLLISAVVMEIGIVLQFLMRPGNPVVTTIIILACIGAAVLLTGLLLRTYYSVDKGTLQIVSGPFRWNIAIDQISSVTPTRSPWSSPALSLDRLLIHYGKGRRIMVSPENKHEFLRAIGHVGE